jgi:uncharacterized integral membrane protein
MGAAWVGICAAALTLVALIVLMVQNTRRVEVTFLWMHGTLPVALALLVAGVGSAILAMVFTPTTDLASHRSQNKHHGADHDQHNSEIPEKRNHETRPNTRRTHRQ